MLIILLLVFMILVLFDAPGLIRGKYWRELAVYSGFMLLALLLSALLVLGAPLPAITTEIGNLIKKVFNL